MPVLRNTLLTSAPPRSVAAALLDVDLARRVAAPAELVAHTAAPGLFTEGDEVDFRLRGIPRARLRTRVLRIGMTGMSTVLVAGPLTRLRHEVTLAETGAGTLVTDSLEWTSPCGPLGRVADSLVGRRLVLRVLANRARGLRDRAEELAAAPVVVGAAIVREGRLLVQQRAYPAECAGRWELPGGRVEPGETDAEALVRECREELGVEVVPGDQVGPDIPLPNGKVLRLLAARLADPAAEPRPYDHQALSWSAAADLVDMDWLPADRVVVPDLRRLLAASGPAGAVAHS